MRNILNGETNDSYLCHKYDRHEPTKTELQAPDLGYSHTECVENKNVCVLCVFMF